MNHLSFPSLQKQPLMGPSYRGRLAPSTTGGPHLGTLLSALLAWCDARAAGGQLCLRLEDLDPDRARPAYADQLRWALTWLGLDWDDEVWQSQAGDAHAGSLDTLAAMGRLYACSCSRSTVRANAVQAPDGAWAYDNRCRQAVVGPGQWRRSSLPLRLALPDQWVAPRSLDAHDLAHRPRRTFGDPVVRRRDGCVAYTLAVVVDDAAWQVTHVVRGRDLAVHSATQALIGQLLGLPEPKHRHHFLLRHRGGHKLTKGRGDTLRENEGLERDGPACCGRLALMAGLRPTAAPCLPGDLVEHFAWHSLRTADLELDVP